MLKKQADIFKSLSDPNRIRIIKMLQIKPLCVCEMTEILGLAPSTVSQHLTVLKKAGFIKDSKDGKWINYSLNMDERIPEIASVMTALNFMLEEDKNIKKDRAKLSKVNRLKICRK
jgi:ArsR family transcriptional regulator